MERIYQLPVSCERPPHNSWLLWVNALISSWSGGYGLGETPPGGHVWGARDGFYPANRFADIEQRWELRAKAGLLGIIKKFLETVDSRKRKNEARNRNFEERIKAFRGLSLVFCCVVPSFTEATAAASPLISHCVLHQCVLHTLAEWPSWDANLIVLFHLKPSVAPHCPQKKVQSLQVAMSPSMM